MQLFIDHRGERRASVTRYWFRKSPFHQRQAWTTHHRKATSNKQKSSLSAFAPFSRWTEETNTSLEFDEAPIDNSDCLHIHLI